MRIAVEGCGHGTLHAIYASVKKTCEVNGWDGVDLLIIGGDFQAVRNAYDLNTMSVPRKYLAIGDFHEYYSGSRIAPYTTIFVGGNHEASSHLQELYYGGWVAKNIYYLGAANVIRFGDLRIAGLSGIWKGYNYRKPHFERLPYTADEVKSLYHVREMDVRKLMLLRTQVDIGMSHDWPKGVEMRGDYRSLFQQKDLFEADSKAGTLGSVAAKSVMDRLRPPHWFAAHLHCKFAARIDHAAATELIPHADTSPETPATIVQEAVKNADEIDIDLEDDTEQTDQAPVKNVDEIDLDIDEETSKLPSVTPHQIVSTGRPNDSPIVPVDIRSQLPASFTRPPQSSSQPTSIPPPPGITNTVTDFLALDKCLPRRLFLQILDIEPLQKSNSVTETPRLSYDPEWLAILRVFASHDPHQPVPYDPGEVAYTPLIQAQEAWIDEHLAPKGKLIIPENFEMTSPPYDGADIRATFGQQPPEYTNPQTKVFCEWLGIPNHFDDAEQVREERRKAKAAQIATEAISGAGFGRGRGGGRGDGHGGRGRGRGNGRGRGRSRGYR